MSKVITFSRQFPAYHPKAGQPTYFVEKIIRGWDSLHTFEEIAATKLIPGKLVDLNVFSECKPKWHTIRAGNRFKVGDKFSPRVWDGKPYNSKQIIIAPDIEVKKVWDIVFTPKDDALFINGSQYYPIGYEEVLNELATNDGLSVTDLVAWFNKPLTGQIICWNESIEY